MKIQITSPWRELEAIARADREELIEVLEVEYGHGLETIRLSDHKEYRATCSIDLSDYEIKKKATPSKK